MNKKPPTDSLSHRPASYFGSADLQLTLMTRVKGAGRRALLREILDAGDLRGISHEISQPSLRPSERRAAGQIHPALMGGEYLPDLGNMQLEIARITIDSTLSDVTSVYAQPDGNRIRYTVVDEYEGATLGEKTERWSRKPLTMGELVRFFLGAWNLLEVLEMNFQDDTQAKLGFFHGSSEFYPSFHQALVRKVRASTNTPHGRHRVCAA